MPWGNRSKNKLVKKNNKDFRKSRKKHIEQGNEKITCMGEFELQVIKVTK